MNIENISNYIAAIPALFFSVLFTSLTAFPFVLAILENPFYTFKIALAAFGLTVTFLVLFLSLRLLQDIFFAFALPILNIAIQSGFLIYELYKKVKNLKKIKGAA